MNNIALFFVALLYSQMLFSQNVDIDLLEKINLQRNTRYDAAWVLVTNTAFPLSVSTPLVLYGSGVVFNDSVLRSYGIYTAAVFATEAIVVLSMKHSIKRPRPFVTYPYIQKVSSGGSPSFPSGHTSDAFATATSLSFCFKKWYVAAPAFVWASAVAYSRMRLGVHYPSDVLAGMLIGSGSAYVNYKIMKWLHNKDDRKISPQQ